MMNKENRVSADAKRSFIEACAKFCSFDLRPFEIIHGNGFTVLCQSLLDIAYENSCRINASDLIPDPTTISRRVRGLAEGIRTFTVAVLLKTLYYLEHREELIQTLLSDLKIVKLFGITTDFWKNKFSSDSYLTITLHYNKDGDMVKIVLKTIQVNESKTGGMFADLHTLILLTHHFRQYQTNDSKDIKIVWHRS